MYSIEKLYVYIVLDTYITSQFVFINFKSICKISYKCHLTNQVKCCQRILYFFMPLLFFAGQKMISIIKCKKSIPCYFVRAFLFTAKFVKIGTEETLTLTIFLIRMWLMCKKVAHTKRFNSRVRKKN